MLNLRRFRNIIVTALKEIFVEDVVSITDGGGIAGAARVPVIGRERVAKFIAGFASHFWTNVTLSWVQVNGKASVLLARGDVMIALFTVDASPQGITQILWVMNPAKLAAIARSLPASSQHP